MGAKIAPMARPRGEVSIALLQAARQGPGTVRELAARALVGRGAASYTTSRLVASGELVTLKPGKPAILAMPPEGAAALGPQALGSVLAGWGRTG